MRFGLYAIAVLLLLALAGVTPLLYIYAATRAYVETPGTVPTTSVAMVLGASVTARGVLSPVLEERADTAAALYRAHKVSKILVTGDNATLFYDEVDPVGRYLVAQGIPKQDIFLDHAGFDTYSSMYRAREVFEVTSVTIVSQPFHLPRALYLARSLGLTAYAVPAGAGESYFFNYLREIPASVKALYDLAAARVPEYLGAQYPVWGDGEATWGGATTTLFSPAV